MISTKWFLSVLKIVIGLLLITLFLFAPLAKTASWLSDPGLGNGQIPAFTYDWHQSLSERIGPWARKRAESGVASELSIYDISGTEWPIFSGVFYLWATEALEEDAKRRGVPKEQLPSVYAKEPIEAVADLVADPRHANWVKIHWGKDYLTKENLFYRMLLISGLSSYQKLSGNNYYEDELRQQTLSLARELDASPFGLLDDYPGQCYPIDIVTAVAAIARADQLLGTDHSGIIQRAVRGFEGTRLDSQTGLPAYVADSTTGKGIGSARGVGVSFMSLWAAEIWPDKAEQWYEGLIQHFWNSGIFVSGVREFPRSVRDSDWLMDVDSGPVIAGFGTTASVFGLAAARTFGDTSRAYALSTQALATLWPTWNNTLISPYMLSNLSDAPYTGEAIILFAFTRTPYQGISSDSPDMAVPLSVFLLLGLPLMFGLYFLLKLYRHARSFFID